MVWNNFCGYYYRPEGLNFVAWDPTLHHRGVNEAEADELVNIKTAAQTYRPPCTVREKLNSYITQEIYECLISEEVDEEFLEGRGFVVVANKDSSLVLYHQDYPQYLIKIGRGKHRVLPMESTLKQQQKKPEEVNRPILNLNLLRASGREYFVKKLNRYKESPFEFPQEYIYTSPHAKKRAPDYKRYFSISEHKEICSGTETVEILKSLNQEQQYATAEKIHKVIRCTGMHDWHKNNLLLSKTSGCFVWIDSEPIGSLIDTRDKGDTLFNFDEHVLLGLIIFRDKYCITNGLTAMAEATDWAIIEYMERHPEIEVASDMRITMPLPIKTSQKVKRVVLIVASICLPLIPLIFLIGALLSTYVYPPTDDNERIVAKYSYFHRNTPGFIYLRNHIVDSV